MPENRKHVTNFLLKKFGVSSTVIVVYFCFFLSIKIVFT